LAKTASETGVQVDALTPDQWLDAFYANRKGSGKAVA
jgi:hypothetical protein